MSERNPLLTGAVPFPRRPRFPTEGMGFTPKQVEYLQGEYKETLKREIMAALGLTPNSQVVTTMVQVEPAAPPPAVPTPAPVLEQGPGFVPDTTGPSDLGVPMAKPEMAAMPRGPIFHGDAIEESDEDEVVTPPAPPAPPESTKPSEPVETTETAPSTPVIDMTKPVTAEEAPGATPAMLTLINEQTDPAKRAGLLAIANQDKPGQVKRGEMNQFLKNTSV